MSVAVSWQWWVRVVRDPYTLLLGAAAVLQVALVVSTNHFGRPGWLIAVAAGYALTIGLAVLGRIRRDERLQTAAPFVFLVVVACWRLADGDYLAGLGALVIVSIFWLAFYGSLAQTWSAVVLGPAAMILPSLVTGADRGDWARAGLTFVVAALVGPTINSLARRGDLALARVSALEPVGSRLDAVLHAATGHLIIVCSPDGTIVEFNQGAERMLGYRAEEIVGLHTPMLFHDRGEVAARAAELGLVGGVAVLEHLGRQGEVAVRDWTYYAKDGRRLTVSLSVSAIHDHDGGVAGFVGIGTDVTEPRAAVQSLRAQQELYQLLVEHLPSTTVGLYDADLVCVTIGGHQLERSGTRPEDYVGRRVDDFFREPDRPRVLEFFRSGLDGPARRELDLGDGHTYEFAVLPVHEPGRAPLVLSVTRDVTEQRRAESDRQQMLAALALSEASFREAFEGAPIGMALTTVEAKPERFLRVNPAFAAILGRAPEDLVGLAVADVTHPEDAVIELDLEIDGDVSKVPLRKRFMRPSGRAVWVDVSYAVVRDQAGTPLHVVKQIQDVNTIKESERALLDALEQQRAATASLRELDRIRTELVGTVSHELRTPLTSIHGYLELLSDEPLTDGQVTMVDVARRNAEKLGNLVNDLLVLVRLDSTEAVGVIADGEVEVQAVVAASVDTVRPEFVERRQQLEVRVPTGPAFVRGDADQLDRVLVNLLSNASKYTPDGGTICVEVSGDRDSVTISVSDTGIGIPLDEQDRLFTRFFRASSARANAISGNGLGLAIVKTIIERHDGQVSVVSAPDAGSRFVVTLPSAVPAAIPG